jgi:hypothetical protein
MYLGHVRQIALIAPAPPSCRSAQRAMHALGRFLTASETEPECRSKIRCIHFSAGPKAPIKFFCPRSAEIGDLNFSLVGWSTTEWRHRLVASQVRNTHWKSQAQHGRLLKPRLRGLLFTHGLSTKMNLVGSTWESDPSQKRQNARSPPHRTTPPYDTPRSHPLRIFQNEYRKDVEQTILKTPCLPPSFANRDHQHDAAALPRAAGEWAQAWLQTLVAAQRCATVCTATSSGRSLQKGPPPLLQKQTVLDHLS